MPFQKTLVLVKPDAVARGLMGRIISRFEDKGLSILGLKVMRVSKALAARHYAEHKGKPFYPVLINFITSGPLVAMVVEGRQAVSVARKMMGSTYCGAAEPGTIRGDFGVSETFNLVHGSDSVKSARREIRLYFKPSELVKIPHSELSWVYNTAGKTPR